VLIHAVYETFLFNLTTIVFIFLEIFFHLGKDVVESNML
jgi:hypothetical protein